MRSDDVYRGLADAVAASNPGISAVALTTVVGSVSATLLDEGRTAPQDVREAASRISVFASDPAVTEFVVSRDLSPAEVRAALEAASLCPGFWPIC